MSYDPKNDHMASKLQDALTDAYLNSNELGMLLVIGRILLLIALRLAPIAQVANKA